VWWLRPRHPARPDRAGVAAAERAGTSACTARSRPRRAGPRRPAWPRSSALRRVPREYNDERPHEALGQATPASRYAPSPRPYPRGCRRSSTRRTGRCGA
jgi:hypothetical protein